MKVNVEKRRTPARIAATMGVTGSEGIEDALQRLRSWALTRGLTISGDLSWVLPATAGGEAEARCPLADVPDVHPDVGIGVRQLASEYVAEVDVRAPETPVSPESAYEALCAWARDNGFEPAGPGEVFKLGIDRREFRLSLPIKRRKGTRTIDL